MQSGSPVALLLTWAGHIRDIKTIPAARALAHRCMNLLRAKRARATALPDAATDVRAIRGNPGLTQEQLALRYGLDVNAVRNWEAGRRSPDTAAQSNLRAIDADPTAVEAALWRRAK